MPLAGAEGAALGLRWAAVPAVSWFSRHLWWWEQQFPWQLGPKDIYIPGNSA